MPTSGPGISKTRAGKVATLSGRARPVTRPTQRRHHVPTRQDGFTLIELLVVLVIIGIAAGMVGISAVAAPDRHLHQDAERLVLSFAIAQSEARSDGRIITWRADAGGYHFERPGRRVGSTGSADDEAIPPPDDFRNDPELKPQAWSAGTVSVTPSGPKGWLRFDTEWMSDPTQLTLAAGGRTVTITRDAGGAYAVQ